MEKKIFSADTVDDAIIKASVEMGVPSDQLDYVVIDKGSSGFLGFGKRQASINAWKKEEASSGQKETEKLQKEVKTEQKKEEKPVKEAEKKAPEKPAKAENKNTQKKENKKEEKAAPAKKEEKPVQEKIKTTENDEKHFEEGRVFLLNTFEKMGMKVNVEYVYNEEDNALEINLSGEEMGVLIGKRGQTLDSLQYLTSLVVNRSGEHYIRVKLDTENYRERRKETLEALAKNIAYKVKRTRKSVSLEPMNPYERRIIHSALQPDNFVMTKSEGEEPFRHVVVFYKRNKNGEER